MGEGLSSPSALGNVQPTGHLGPIALEAPIRRTRLRLGVALCTIGALIAACSSAEPTATTGTTAPTTTTTVATTTTSPSTTTTIAPTTTTTLPSTTTTPPFPNRTLPVPDHATPAIDGVIADGEWDGATETAMTDGSSLSWMRSDKSLYVGLRGHSLGAVNLAIASDEELWILHSSAALGSMLYAQDGDVWRLVHDFDWCCRGANNEAAREALRVEEGWQANIGFAGDPGTVEYEVTLPWSDAAVAVSHQSEDAGPAFWPADLSLEAAAELMGPFPDEASYHVGEWYHLDAASP